VYQGSLGSLAGTTRGSRAAGRCARGGRTGAAGETPLVLRLQRPLLLLLLLHLSHGLLLLGTERHLGLARKLGAPLARPGRGAGTSRRLPRAPQVPLLPLLHLRLRSPGASGPEGLLRRCSLAIFLATKLGTSLVGGQS